MQHIPHITIIFSLVLVLVLLPSSSSSSLPTKIRNNEELTNSISKADSSSSFAAALQTLEKQIGYNFKSVDLLRRAMTHPSFSGENNRALSILGLNAIEASISLRSLESDLEISAKDLSRRITGITKLGSCAIDGSRLGLEKVVRVSVKTNSSMPSVVCGAFRAIFGAVSVDTGKADDGGDVFWNVHRVNGGEALAL